MKNKTLFTLAIIIITTIISCSNNSSASTDKVNNESNLTNLTSEGRYIECKMNGTLIKAEDFGQQILYVPEKKAATIWGKTNDGIISIIVEPVEATGSFKIIGNSINDAGIQIGKKMYSVKKQKSVFNVTISSIDELTIGNSEGKIKAIKGTFEGELEDQDGNVVRITEGKFSSQ